MYRALYLYCSFIQTSVLFITNFSYYLFFYSSASCYAALFAQQKQPNQLRQSRAKLCRYGLALEYFLQCLVYNTDNKLENACILIKLLTTGEAYKAFNVTENKTNFSTDIFLLKYYLDLKLLRCLPEYCCQRCLVLIIFKNNFSKRSEWLILEEMSVRSDSECFGSNSV